MAFIATLTMLGDEMGDNSLAGVGGCYTLLKTRQVYPYSLVESFSFLDNQYHENCILEHQPEIRGLGFSAK
jgi:hypothetical protein